MLHSGREPGCPCAEGNGTGSATLSQNDHFAPVQVDISNFQTNQLPLSDSGIGEKSDDGLSRGGLQMTWTRMS